mgnify:FL=1
MKLYLNKPCENGDRYFIDNKHIGFIWLEDEKNTEYYIGTFDDAYAVIRLLDRERLTDTGLSYVQRREDRKAMRKFWQNVSKVSK